MFCLFFCRYGAKVVDVQAKLNPRIAEEKAKHIENVRKEATESAIEQVKKELKEAQEKAAQAREQAGTYSLTCYHRAISSLESAMDRFMITNNCSIWRRQLIG